MSGHVPCPHRSTRVNPCARALCVCASTKLDKELAKEAQDAAVIDNLRNQLTDIDKQTALKVPCV